MNAFIYLYIQIKFFKIYSFGCFRAFVWSLSPRKAYLLSLKNVSLETHSTYFTCHNKAKRHKLATFQDKQKPIHIKIFFMVENIAWSNGVLFRLLLLQMNVAFFYSWRM